MNDRNVRAQRVAERRQQILDAARAAAESGGWAAVTLRHLADTIGYTQPVIYSHFPDGKTEIMRHVALGGFAELTKATRAAAADTTGAPAISAVAEAYLGFAVAHPALYDAMFQLAIDARFAHDDAEAELQAGFAALSAALGEAGTPTTTEVFWSALHGMSLLERSGRMLPQDRSSRVAELAARFAG